MLQYWEIWSGTGLVIKPVLIYMSEKKPCFSNAIIFFEQKNFMRSMERQPFFLAKFLPIIRTFAPIVGGIVKMKKATFLFYNILGSVCWVSSMMLGGYFLQAWVVKNAAFSLKDHIEGITIGIILVTTLPVLYKLFFGKKDEMENDPPVSNK